VATELQAYIPHEKFSRMTKGGEIDQKKQCVSSDMRSLRWHYPDQVPRVDELAYRTHPLSRACCGSPNGP